MKKISYLIALWAIVLVGCTPIDAPSLSLLSFHFENINPELLAGPSVYGDNLYSSYGRGQFTSYTDPETGLSFGLNKAPSYDWNTYEYVGDTYELWNGGIALSRWNNRTVAGVNNQCSVYSPISSTFALVSCAGLAAFSFPEGVAYSAHSLMVCNTSYAALSMLQGDAFAKKHTYENQDWLKVTLTGIDIQGKETGNVDFFLSDFRTPQAPGVILGWQSVDIRSLGVINKLSFSLSGSDRVSYDGGKTYYLNTPSYLCVDNLTFVK